jgi:DNA-binding transcriptional MerR regulator
LRAKRVGFSLTEIRELIDLYDIGDGRKLQRQVTMEKCQSRIDQLMRQRTDIDEHIEELKRFVKVLKQADPSLDN